MLYLRSLKPKGLQPGLICKVRAAGLVGEFRMPMFPQNPRFWREDFPDNLMQCSPLAASTVLADGHTCLRGSRGSQASSLLLKEDLIGTQPYTFIPMSLAAFPLQWQLSKPHNTKLRMEYRYRRPCRQGLLILLKLIQDQSILLTGQLLSLQQSQAHTSACPVHIVS